jgi:hypothetical protein
MSEGRLKALQQAAGAQIAERKKRLKAQAG